MISKSLSTSRRFAQLIDVIPDIAEFAQSLYPLLVAHSDDFGRQAGDLFTVKHKVHPASLRSVQDFERALHAMHDVRLLVWYDDGQGGQVIQIVKFEKHQSGLHKRTRSDFPAPPRDSGKFLEGPKSSITTELNGTELKGTEKRSPISSFESFWQRWPKKVAKEEARKTWKQLGPDVGLQAQIFLAIDRQSASKEWRKDNGQFIPHPAKWLRERRWEDETTSTATEPTDLVAADVRALCERAHIKRHDIASWFPRVTLAQVNGSTTLLVSDENALGWIRKHYAAQLQNAVVAAGGHTLDILGES